MRSTPWTLVALGLSLAGCPQTNPPADVPLDAPDAAPPDAPAADAPAADAGCTEVTRVHSLNPATVYVTAGGEARVQLRLARDRNACGASYAVTVADPTLATPPATDAPVRIDARRGNTAFTVRGVREGVTRLRVVQSDPPDPMGTSQTEVELRVLPTTRPACPTDTPVASMQLTPGARIAGTAGSPLAAASVALPMNTALAAPIDATLACAQDLVAPDGYDAIGPAVTFGPAYARLPREVSFTVPANPALVPSMYELHVELAYTAPGISPRVVPVANTRFTRDGAGISFQASRLGTYQAVIRRGVATARVRRRLNYHAIMGISMGGVGSSMIATRHPARFDSLAPLGGPADSGFSGDYLRRWVLGGFCTADDRARLGDAACAGTTNDRTPPPSDLGMAIQNYEHFFAPPGEGTGGTFDRRARFQGFRDIARMFGNPMMPTAPDDRLLPLGVPRGETARTDAERCANPVVLGGAPGMPRYYDDEYNPTGEFPVITFCDGTSLPGMPGEWDGARGNYPVEITLAVDLNRNGRRDAGEPVIRDFSEPYDDVGNDGTPSAREAGYHPVTNPDPAGDDYDRQYNPSGTEGNFLRDAMEPFRDVGLDGVACPAGETCPYDAGEGNGRFDTPDGPDQAESINPRVLFAQLPRSEAQRLGVWIDGGVRDALQFGVNANHFAGAIPHAGLPLHIYNGFSSLITAREPPPASDDGYEPREVDYAHLPRHTMLRYGFVDASPAQIQEGDGAHAGTPTQITHRILTSAFRLGALWPETDREVTAYSAQRDDAGRCAAGYSCIFDFRSERANRTGRVGIVLPPGYHRPENRERRYPVVFFLHGYGMDPGDLIAAGALLGPAMASGQQPDWQRLEKFILVLPDGRCQASDNCLEGTFYADAPGGRGQVESYFLDLYDFVDRTYRVRAPEEVEVPE